jgi:hypothetical protein
LPHIAVPPELLPPEDEVDEDEPGAGPVVSSGPVVVVPLSVELGSVSVSLSPVLPVPGPRSVVAFPTENALGSVGLLQPSAASIRDKLIHFIASIFHHAPHTAQAPSTFVAPSIAPA